MCFVYVELNLFTSAEGGREMTFRVIVSLVVRFSCGSLSLFGVALGAPKSCMRCANFSVCVEMLVVRLARVTVSVWEVGLMFIGVLVHSELGFNGRVRAAVVAALLAAACLSMVSLRVF